MMIAMTTTPPIPPATPPPITGPLSSGTEVDSDVGVFVLDLGIVVTGGNEPLLVAVEKVLADSVI